MSVVQRKTNPLQSLNDKLSAKYSTATVRDNRHFLDLWVDHPIIEVIVVEFINNQFGLEVFHKGQCPLEGLFCKPSIYLDTEDEVMNFIESKLIQSL